MLIPNATTLVQMAIFLVVYFVLSRMLFAPYLRLQQIREEALSADGEVDRAPLEEKIRLLEEREKKLSQELAGLRERALQAVRPQAEASVAGAREKAAALVQEANARWQETHEAILAELEKERQELADTLLRKLVA